MIGVVQLNDYVLTTEGEKGFLWLENSKQLLINGETYLSFQMQY